MSAAAIPRKNRAFFSLFRCAWQHRHLIALLVARRVEARFRGSLLGKLWTALIPLFMLGLYTFVFGFVLKVHWPGAAKSQFEVALLYFAGLTLFDFYFECISGAPALMLENISYIKKVVFPLEILPFVVLGGALVRLAVTSTILVVFYLAIVGLPAPAALAIPLILVPFALVAVGIVWFVSALGVYVHDLRQVVVLAAPVTMYLSPIFFPMSSVPEAARPLFYANPLTFIIETIRGALFDGTWPDWGILALYAVLAWIFASLGYYWFVKIKPGFADVV